MKCNGRSREQRIEPGATYLGLPLYQEIAGCYGILLSVVNKFYHFQQVISILIKQLYYYIIVLNVMLMVV